jgi:ABC-type transport system involved in multi-copper enzyme maturation permease subunit
MAWPICAWSRRVKGLPFLLLLAGAGATWWFADRLTPTQRGLAWAGLLLGLVIMARLGWIKALGPLLPYEFVRSTRRSRYLLLRLYIYFVLLLGICVLMVWYASDRNIECRGREAAGVAQAFFHLFLAAQFVWALLLVPGYVAPALTDEKERGTLEFLLATDLRNWEIILGKLVVRLALLVLMTLTGLPILCLLMLLGGIEPDLVVAGFAATVVTMATLAAISLLNSVYARRSRDAILSTYLVLIAYLLLSGLSTYLPVAVVMWQVELGPCRISVGACVDWFQAANPILQLYQLARNVAGGAQFPDVLPGLLRDYAVAHGCLIVLFTAWASLRLRAVFVKQASGEARRPSAGRWVPSRPRVGDRPVLWKEVFVEPGLRLRWSGRAVLSLFVVGSFVPALLLTINADGLAPGAVREGFGYWTRVMGTLVGCLLLIGVALRAATAVSGERERLTLDGLLTSPLSGATILAGKWLGSVLSARRGWLWLGLIWAWGLWEARPDAAALPMFVLAWLVYAALLATAGLWFSLACRTSLRAVVCTLFSAGVLGFGFLVLPVYYSVALQSGLADPFLERLCRFMMGLTPPLVLGRLLPFWDEATLGGMGAAKEEWETRFALLGLLCWAVVAGVWWWATCRYFGKVTGRRALLQPDGKQGNAPC